MIAEQILCGFLIIVSRPIALVILEVAGIGIGEIRRAAEDVVIHRRQVFVRSEKVVDVLIIIVAVIAVSPAIVIGLVIFILILILIIRIPVLVVLIVAVSVVAVVSIAVAVAEIITHPIEPVFSHQTLSVKEFRTNLKPFARSTGKPDRKAPMELLEQFSRGELEAFETLFRQYQGEVYGWIVRIVRNPAVAEDLTIETFWRIYRAHARFDPERGFGAWARRIATNAAIDHLKSARHEIDLRNDIHAPAQADSFTRLSRHAPVTKEATTDGF